MRPLIVGRNVYLHVRADGITIKRKKYRQVQPSEMIQVYVTPEELIEDREIPAQVEISIEHEE